MTVIAQKTIDVVQPRTGEGPLDAYPAVLGSQVEEQLGFQFVTRGEVGVASFARKRSVNAAIPVRHNLAEARPGGYDEDVTRGIDSPGVQDGEVFREKQVNTVGVSLKVVDEGNLLKIQIACQVSSIDAPGQIWCSHFSLPHRPGNAEASALGP